MMVTKKKPSIFKILSRIPVDLINELRGPLLPLDDKTSFNNPGIHNKNDNNFSSLKGFVNLDKIKSLKDKYKVTINDIS